MGLEFRLREDNKKNQIETLVRECKAASARASNMRDRVYFEKAPVCIRKATLKELFRRGYLAFRVKKHGEGYTCFMFETATPVELRMERKAVLIERLGTVDAKVAITGMNAIIAGRKEARVCSTHFENKVTYIVYPPEMLGAFKDETDMQKTLKDNFPRTMHTHPYCKLENYTLALSKGDFCMLADLGFSIVPFIASLGIDGTEFMAKIRELGEAAFDGRESLKVEHVRSIAEQLAEECTDDNKLQEQYRDIGMPIVAATIENGRVHIYSKLKIT